MESTNLISNINIVFEKLFNSVERDVFKAIDNIFVIDETIVEKEPLSNLIQIDGINYIGVLANAFIIFFCIYYIVINFISMYNGNKSESVFKFILKIIVVGILTNFSIYILSTILQLNNIFTEILDGIARLISKDSLTFECLKDKIINIEEYIKEDTLSLNGMTKGMLTFGSISVLMTFAIRYVTILFLILISPLAFICLCTKLTSGIFFSYMKVFFINLMMQNVVKIVLMLPLSCTNMENIMYKIIMVGSIYVIYRINTFTKEIFSKITSDKFGRD